jgi:hypothetical protein
MNERREKGRGKYKSKEGNMRKIREQTKRKQRKSEI